jgi:hypothetical protein
MYYCFSVIHAMHEGAHTMARSQAKTQADHQHAIAYVRVSTSGQAEDGVSLDAQRSKMA